MKVCPRCGGSGEVTDPLVLGQTLRSMRVEAGVTLLRMAEVMKMSKAHLSNLENGKRAWLGEVTGDRYCDALDSEIERQKKNPPKQRTGKRKDTGLDGPDERAKNEAWLGKRD